MCDLTFLSPPRISLTRFTAVLESRRSPAAKQATALYAIICSYGLDPAIALAFFWHESKLGTEGKARFTRNWGNIRKGQGNAIITTGGWAWYTSWEKSLRDWCLLIVNKYIRAWHLPTVGQALATYAPSSDGNNPNGYAQVVCRLVASWQEGT